MDKRKEVTEYVTSLAFPFGKRGTSAVGIFSFLPTTMVTKFAFIIQADFMLASSRETILLDNIWNLGILEHVPSSFVNAITSYVESTKTDPRFSFTQVLKFMQTQESPFKELNKVRQSIRIIVQAQSIVPYE